MVLVSKFYYWFWRLKAKKYVWANIMKTLRTLIYSHGALRQIWIEPPQWSVIVHFPHSVRLWFNKNSLGTQSIWWVWGFPSAAAAAAKSLQSCLTLCDPIDGSPPGSPVPGILQARTLEWVAISFSNAWKWKLKVKSLIHVWLLETPWAAAHQAPPSMGFSRQEYWSGVPLPSPFQVLIFFNSERLQNIFFFWSHRTLVVVHIKYFEIYKIQC